MSDLPNQTETEMASNVVAPASVASEPSTSGPINLDQIRKMREAQQARMEQDKNRQNRERQGARGNQSKPKPKSESAPEGSKLGASANSAEPQEGATPEKIDAEAMGPRYRSNKDSAPVAAKVPVPNVRGSASEEELKALEAEFSGGDLEGMMIGDRPLRGGVGPASGSSKHRLGVQG